MISRRYGLTKTTVYQWWKGTTPMGKRAGHATKVPELLYVLGALLGDGCIYHWKGNFQIWLVGEREFAAKFADKLTRCLGRQVRYYKYGKKNAWFVRIGNAELFFLVEGARRDTATVERLVRESGSAHGWVEFIEGFFDAEGCVKVIRERIRQTPKICLDICNTNLGLLAVVQGAARKVLGIELRLSKQTASPPHRTSYHLRIYKKDDVRRFLEAVPTTKLTDGKKPLVEAWLTKNR